MLREAWEETNIADLDLRFKGLKTWSKSNRTGFGGLYLYIAYLPDDYVYPTPQQTDEGIILHPDNLGVAYNLPSSLRMAFNDERCFDHHSVFSGNYMIKETHTEIDPSVETSPVKRKQYLDKYLQMVKKA